MWWRLRARERTLFFQGGQRPKRLLLPGAQLNLNSVSFLQMTTGTGALRCAKATRGAMFKMQIPRPHPRDSDSPGLGWRPGVCIL